MLFRNLWLMVPLLLTAGGILAREGAAVALGVLLLSSGGVARLWDRYALARVFYRRELEAERAMVGDTVAMRVSVTNRKPLPLPWLDVREEIPMGLSVEGVRAPTQAAGAPTELRRTTSLGWYRRATWAYRLRCDARGYYRIGPARLRSGDLFGVFERRRRAEVTSRLVVYPALLDLERLGFASRRAFGDRKGTERLFEDPLRIAGVREYQPGDPMKRIAWGPTARVGRLHSRVYEPSTTPSLLVVLNVATMPHTWEGYDPELLERAVSVAASVARDGMEERHAVGLLANASFPEADRPIRVAAGRGPEQLPRLLEALAAVSPFVLVPVEELLERERASLPWGATVVVVTARASESLGAVLLRLRDAGHPVHVLSVAREAVDLPGGPFPSGKGGRVPVTNLGPGLEARRWERPRERDGAEAVLRA